MHCTDASVMGFGRSAKGRSMSWALAFGVAAMVAVGAPAVVIAAGQVKGERYFELEAGSKYTSPRALCEAVAKADQATPPYDRVLAARDKGDSVWCERSDSSGNKTDQHHGSVIVNCPANSQLAADGTCLCDDQFVPRGNACVSASTAGPTRPLREKKDLAASPEKRGMTEIDDIVFQGVAMNKGLFIIVRDSNAAATNFNGKPDHLPKPEALKAKTRKTDPGKGLAAADPKDPRLITMLEGGKPPKTYEEYVSELEKQKPGFLVGPPPEYFIYTKIGDKQYTYYSDYDLHGVYDREGKPAFTPEFQNLLNERFKHPMVQHGAHDDWKDNMKPGLNCGPQAESTAYLPTGEIVYLAKIEDMEAFYRKHKLRWPYGPVGQIAAKCFVPRK